MKELKGIYTTAKIMIDDVEPECIDQIKFFINHPAFTNPVAIMPDTHSGKGSVIGFTMPFTDKVIPNVVGVDVGCFTGDTSIPLLNGLEYKIKDLVHKFFWVYSNHNGLVVPGKATAIKTKTNAKIIEIYVSGGSKIRCTPDQEFLLTNNTYKMAKDLKPLDSLMPLYRTYQTKDGYEYCKSLKGGKLTHKMVWEFFNGKKPIGYSIHHKDLCWYNNDPENLELLNYSKHSQLHRSLSNPFNDPEFKSKRLKTLRKKGFFDAKYREKKIETAIKNIVSYNLTEKAKIDSKNNGKRGSKYLIKFNRTNNNTIYICSCGRKIKGKGGFKKHQQKCLQNHKVLFVREIKDREDVYCLQVKEFHNFALSSGVFVHNCGMLSYNFGKEEKVKTSIEDLDRLIRLRIPFGQDVHDQSVINMEREFPWDRVNILAQKFAQAYREQYGEFSIPKYDIRWFQDKCDAVGGGVRRMINSIGTLGGGNHFIETGVSDKEEYWITIHTGSRNFGKRICEYWQNKAFKFHTGDTKEEHRKKIEQLKKEITDGKLLFQKIKELKAERREVIDMKGCEWLEDLNAAGYLLDMIFAQVYAEVNRQYIGNIIKKILKLEPINTIETVHNFIDFRDFIIRKGSVRSYIGEEFVLPFNMRDGILICDGKSNPEWNFSAPHGAGRVMSRTKAKKSINFDTFKKQMDGIYSTSVDISTLDEAPDAYKAPDAIIEAIQPTATIIDRIKPLHNMKDNKEFIRKKRKNN